MSWLVIGVIVAVVFVLAVLVLGSIAVYALVGGQIDIGEEMDSDDSLPIAPPWTEDESDDLVDIQLELRSGLEPHWARINMLRNKHSENLRFQRTVNEMIAAYTALPARSCPSGKCGSRVAQRSRAS